MMTYSQAHQLLNENLKHLSNISQESKWMLEKIIGHPWEYIFLNYQNTLTLTEEKNLNFFIHKRKNYYPLQYLLKTVEFCQLHFNVCENVLIPREETESLVKYVLDKTPLNSRLLEIGVGSGVISISIKKIRQDIKIDGIDINKDALKCSHLNAKKILGENHNITIFESNLFSKVMGKFDVIVSNPPYISEKELMEEGDPEMKYEPKNALVASKNGYDIYERIAKESIPFLNKNAEIIVEISPKRKDRVITIFEENGFTLQNILNDFMDINRVAIFTKN